MGENTTSLEFTQQVVNVDFQDNFIRVTEEFVNRTADTVNSRYKGDLPCRQITTSLNQQGLQTEKGSSACIPVGKRTTSNSN